MKVRTDFITNSSSSSFIILKKNLDNEQIEAIHKHSELGEKLGIAWADESWSIRENDKFITGDTYMDNFDFAKFLELIDVDYSIITWGEFPFNLNEDNIIKEKDSNGDWRNILKNL